MLPVKQMTETNVQTHPLLAEIDDWLFLSGMSATDFGYRVRRDPAFVHRLRKGRQPRDEVVETTRAAIREMEKELQR